MDETARDLILAAAWLWLGIVVAISFIEAPIKFRAPGITLALGLGIGRLVFRVVNAVEAALGIVIVAAALLGDADGTTGVLVGALAVLLALQLGLVRPPLDRRAARVAAGEEVPSSRVHLAYIAAEGVKVILLVVLGVHLLG
ncbi:MAG: hypothetical protein M0P31_01160 [Solirubrobacteraceae bacterium]|nr:hypothetical protein [Solirubrobacteraceae bacterium]